MSGRPQDTTRTQRGKLCGPAHVDGSEGSEGTTKPFLPSNGSSLRRGPGLLFIYVDVTCHGDSEPRYIAVRRQEGRKG